MTEARIRLREEVVRSDKSIEGYKSDGRILQLELSRPAHTAQEAVQWVYMTYLAAVKEEQRRCSHVTPETFLHS